MRRILSILLLLFTSFPLASPLLAMSMSSDASLPACCRRAGVHHCTYPAEWQTGGVYVAAPPMHCPFCPGGVTVVRHGDTSLHTISIALTGWSIQAVSEARAERGVADTAARNSQTRGPPVILA